MVNTRVANPERRKLNRKIGRQKRSKLKQSEKLLEDPSNPEILGLVYSHGFKLSDLKKKREELPTA